MNYERLAKDWLEQHLKDPDSVKYRTVSRPRQKYVMQKREKSYGYSVCVEYNAKNTYGGYAGFKKHWFWFRDGALLINSDVPMDEISRTIILGDARRQAECDDGPIPETAP